MKLQKKWNAWYFLTFLISKHFRTTENLPEKKIHTHITFTCLQRLTFRHICFLCLFLYVYSICIHNYTHTYMHAHIQTYAYTFGGIIWKLLAKMTLHSQVFSRSLIRLKPVSHMTTVYWLHLRNLTLIQYYLIYSSFSYFVS